MRRRNRILVPAAIATLVLAGCSSSSDDSGESVITDGISTDGASTDDISTDGTTTDGTSSSFFRAENGPDFANSLGSDISRLFSSAFSSVPLLLGTSQGDAAPRLARANQSGSEACFTSGSVDYTFVADDSTGEPVSASINYNDCNEEGAVTTGGLSMSFSGGFDGDNSSFDLVFNDFTVSSNGEVAMINGDVGMSISIVGDTTNTSIQGASLAMSSTGGAEDSDITFGDFQMTSVTNDTTGESSLGGQSDIATPEGSLEISISPVFQVAGGSDFPASGVVSMNASDGSSLQIDADTGDLATYSYVVTDQGGSVSSGIANWADSGIDLDTEF